MATFYAPRSGLCKHFLHCTKIFQHASGGLGKGICTGDSSAFVKPLIKIRICVFLLDGMLAPVYKRHRGRQARGDAALGHQGVFAE